MKEKFSCWKCMYASDKCKNHDSNMYDEYIENIKRCSFAGELDNSYEMKLKIENEIRNKIENKKDFIHEVFMYHEMCKGCEYLKNNVCVNPYYYTCSAYEESKKEEE